MRILTILAASALLSVASAAQAAPIVYTVNDYVGAVGHITGTVTTDGTIGQLGAGNFLSWNLSVAGNGASDTLTSGNSGIFIGGTATSATAHDIFFDFSDLNPSYLLVQKVFSSGANYVCAASTVYPSTPCLQGATVAPQAYTDPSAQFQQFEGRVSIASVAGAVPEPATWAMMIGGFGLAGASLRRRGVKVSYA